ncbi:hypothetical protein F4775DRAFT_540444 [Biscogniauxia sp. FL1348]|nr:hypothetical protein F4775DRAFT_540444 [Biscogniauxia sp. FL1348]
MRGVWLSATCYMPRSLGSCLFVRTPAEIGGVFFGAPFAIAHHSHDTTLKLISAHSFPSPPLSKYCLPASPSHNTSTTYLGCIWTRDSSSAPHVSEPHSLPLFSLSLPISS